MAHWGGKEKGKTEKEWNLELHLVSHARNNGIATTKAAKHCIYRYIYIKNNNNYCSSCSLLCCTCTQRQQLVQVEVIYMFFVARYLPLCDLSAPFPHFVNNGLIFHISLFSCPILRFCTAIQGRVNASESDIICYVPWLMWLDFWWPQKVEEQAKFPQANTDTWL